MNLHWCCGDVYLKNFLNIDIEGVFISEFEVNPNETILENYFKNPFFENNRKRGQYLIDKQLDILQDWPFAKNSIDTIVMISAWEHFYRKETKFIQEQIEKVLKVGGKFIVDFPDIKKDIDIYYETNPEFCFELIYCNGKNIHSLHKWGYTAKTFSNLWSNKYYVQQKVYVQHDYPMIGMEVTKLYD